MIVSQKLREFLDWYFGRQLLPYTENWPFQALFFDFRLGQNEMAFPLRSMWHSLIQIYVSTFIGLIIIFVLTQFLWGSGFSQILNFSKFSVFVLPALIVAGLYFVVQLDKYKPRQDAEQAATLIPRGLDIQHEQAEIELGIDPYLAKCEVRTKILIIVGLVLFLLQQPYFLYFLRLARWSSHEKFRLTEYVSGIFEHSKNISGEGVKILGISNHEALEQTYGSDVGLRLGSGLASIGDFVNQQPQIEANLEIAPLPYSVGATPQVTDQYSYQEPKPSREIPDIAGFFTSFKLPFTALGVTVYTLIILASSGFISFIFFMPDLDYRNITNASTLQKISNFYWNDFFFVWLVIFTLAMALSAVCAFIFREKFTEIFR